MRTGLLRCPLNPVEGPIKQSLEVILLKGIQLLFTTVHSCRAKEDVTWVVYRLPHENINLNVSGVCVCVIASQLKRKNPESGAKGQLLATLP
jgi:hypothetical protein